MCNFLVLVKVDGEQILDDIDLPLQELMGMQEVFFELPPPGNPKGERGVVKCRIIYIETGGVYPIFVVTRIN